MRVPLRVRRCEPNTPQRFSRQELFHVVTIHQKNEVTMAREWFQSIWSERVVSRIAVPQQLGKDGDIANIIRTFQGRKRRRRTRHE